MDPAAIYKHYISEKDVFNPSIATTSHCNITHFPVAAADDLIGKNLPLPFNAPSTTHPNPATISTQTFHVGGE